jgi:hypothetical protein
MLVKNLTGIEPKHEEKARIQAEYNIRLHSNEF